MMTSWPGRRAANEGWKLGLSLVTVVMGMWMSGVVDRPSVEGNLVQATGDLVGVWTWVAESPADRVRSGEPVASLFEFRQQDTKLVARVLFKDRDSSTIEDVTTLKFEDGRLCLETAGGTEFQGLLRDDGTVLDGTIWMNGIRASARLERVATRKSPQVMVPLRVA